MTSTADAATSVVLHFKPDAAARPQRHRPEAWSPGSGSDPRPTLTTPAAPPLSRPGQAGLSLLVPIRVCPVIKVSYGLAFANGHGQGGGGAGPPARHRARRYAPGHNKPQNDDRRPFPDKPPAHAGGSCPQTGPGASQKHDGRSVTRGGHGGVQCGSVASADGDGRLQSPDAGRVARRRAGTAGANPTVRQRELGMRLRDLRNGLGLTVDDVGRQLLCSATKSQPAGDREPPGQPARRPGSCAAFTE